MCPFAGDDELLPCGPMGCRLIAFFTLTLYFTGSALAGIVTGNVTMANDRRMARIRRTLSAVAQTATQGLSRAHQ